MPSMYGTAYRLIENLQMISIRLGTRSKTIFPKHTEKKTTYVRSIKTVCPLLHS